MINVVLVSSGQVDIAQKLARNHDACQTWQIKAGKGLSKGMPSQALWSAACSLMIQP